MSDARAVILMLLKRLQGGESLPDILQQLKPEQPEITVPGLDIDTPAKAAKMVTKGAVMNKSAEPSRLEKLDLKGIGPDMLQAIMNRDVQTVMQQPIMMQRTGERLERIRRLKDELKMPGSHLKPDKPKKNPAALAAEDMMPDSPHMPTGPGSPTAPSNLLGNFSPQQMGQLPKMSSAQKAAGELEDDDSLVKFPGSDETKGDPSPDRVKALVGVLSSMLGSKNDVIPGGLAAGVPDKAFPQEQLEAGTEVELEHTSNPAVAQEIAKDHLVEGDDYYEPRLANLEEGMKADVEKGETKAITTEKTEKNEKRKERDVKQLKKDAYKYGFFLKVAELGMTPAQMEKKASVLGPLLAWLGLKGVQEGESAASTAAGTAYDLGKLGLWLPMLLAPALGAAAGGAYRYTTAPGYESPEDFRHAERMATLKRYTREAKHRAKRKRA